MPLSNEELDALVKKSLTTSTGGLLSPEQTQEFLDLVVDQTPVLQQMRVETGIVNRLQIDGIEFGEPMIIAGQEGVAPAGGDVVAPSIPRLDLNPVEVVAAVDISYDWLRKNIRRESAEQDVNKAIAKRFGMDLINLVFNGDTTLANDTRQNKALRIRDGILKKAAADVNVHDDVIASTPKWGGKDGELSQQLAKIPKQYRDDRAALMHVVSVDTLDAFEDEVAERQTVAADGVLFGNNAVTQHKRVKLVAPFGFPNNTVLTTLMRNLVIGFGRQMQFYRQEQHRARKLELTIVADIDFGYVFGGAVVLGKQA